MKEIEVEGIISLFTELQDCPDKRTAFVKGVLFGLGFANAEKREPNWLIIKSLIEKGRDIANWVDIEKGVFDISNKVWKEQVDLWQTVLEKK